MGQRTKRTLQKTLASCRAVIRGREAAGDYKRARRLRRVATVIQVRLTKER